MSYPYDCEGSSFAFDIDIDGIDALRALPFPSSSVEEIDWTSCFSNPHSSALSTYSDTPSSVDNAPPPSSPLSDHTLVGSPPSWNDCKIFDEDLVLGCIDTAPSPSISDFPFTFEFYAPSVMSPFPPELPLELVDIGYEQPTPQQHEVVAASASAHGLAARGVDVNAAQFAFASTTPASPLSPSASASPEPMEKPKVVKRIRTKADPEAPSQQASPTKRRRRQDTTPKYPCSECDASFARTHNLKVHVSSVHKGERPNSCTHPGCDRNFSRKHDLMRHQQSKHTDLGSPRRKVKTEGVHGPEE
ncbi:hypothetical protein C8Q74DRAFT_215911 [Fomes fomentarius]|nr:hypothetical protein C8Q74DRAFT_215911 [Fomes fomentarius]